jgi:hypothetical protein
MAERHEEGLERSPVFRQLNTGGRFARFGIEDTFFPLILWGVLFIGSLVFEYHQAYCYVALVAGLVGMWLLRLRFPQGGLNGLLRFFLSPRHLSAHARDRYLRPYPGAAPRREKS